MLKYLVALTVMWASFLATVAVAEELGTLTGRFVYDGDPPPAARLTVAPNPAFGNVNLIDESLVVDPNGGLANVVVYVRTPGLPVPKNLPATVHWELKGGRLAPHIVTLSTQQTLVVKNADPAGFNLNVQPLGDVGRNPLLAANQEVEIKFGRQQTIPVPAGCNIRPWVKGYVLPRDNSFATVSQSDGTFRIENLPVQELEFQVWHEKTGYVTTPELPRGRFKLDIVAGRYDLGTIKVDPAEFEPKRATP